MTPRPCNACGKPKAPSAYRVRKSVHRPSPVRAAICVECENRLRRERRRERTEERIRLGIAPPPRPPRDRSRDRVDKRPPARLARAIAECYHRIARLLERVAELDDELARLRGD